MGNCISPFTGGLATTSGVKVFTIAELKKATKVFGDQDMIIEESFGGVVRGYIDPKTLSPSKEGLGIAVVVKMCVLRNGYALKEWLVVDFDFLRLNSHPCLVRLIGYGSNRDYLFLVSEYFPNGSLERHIYRGLEKLDAALSERSHIPTNKNKPARFHYAPPEYIFSGTVHMAGDVYSFGVILLEILTGLDYRRIILAKDAIRDDKENIAEMIDPDLENSYPLEDGVRMCEIIKQCLAEDPKERPSMQQVLDHLNAIAKI